MEDLKKKYL
jgi:hypothetical protein